MKFKEIIKNEIKELDWLYEMFADDKVTYKSYMKLSNMMHEITDDIDCEYAHLKHDPHTNVIINSQNQAFYLKRVNINNLK